MRVLVAPDKLKGALDAAAAADAIAAGLARGLPGVEVERCPIADGGEGTLDVLLAARGGERRLAAVTGPLGEPREAAWGLLPGGVAVVEVAQACGLGLIPAARRDPRATTSRGAGDLVRAALDAGARTIVVALGGSGTNEAGAGALAALGARLLDARGHDLPPGGAALAGLARLDLAGLDPRLREAEVVGACDVTTALVGPAGASRTFGPQKGASPADALALDAALARFAAVAARDAGLVDVAITPRAGAAGGLGAALLLLGGRLASGADLVLDALDVERRLARCDLVLTAEGAIDAQTLADKAVLALARRAAALGKPVVALGGVVAPEARALLDQGVSALVPIAPGPRSLDVALASARDDLARAAEMVGRLLGLSRA